MGDDDWFGGGDDAEPEPTPASAPAPAAAAASATAGDVPVAEETVPEESQPEPPPPAEEEFLDPDKLLLFKHWIRPKYLQYKYLDNYRRSYYDDVLEAVENRQKGYKCTIPRAQIWAERVLRYNRNPINRGESFNRFLEDIKLITRTSVARHCYASQSLSSFNRRYTTKISY